jgi:hypothetical protein
MRPLQQLPELLSHSSALKHKEHNSNWHAGGQRFVILLLLLLLLHKGPLFSKPAAGFSVMILKIVPCGGQTKVDIQVNAKWNLNRGASAISAISTPIEGPKGNSYKPT